MRREKESSDANGIADGRSDVWKCFGIERRKCFGNSGCSYSAGRGVSVAGVSFSAGTGVSGCGAVSSGIGLGVRERVMMM